MVQVRAETVLKYTFVEITTFILIMQRVFSCKLHNFLLPRRHSVCFTKEEFCSISVKSLVSVCFGTHYVIVDFFVVFRIDMTIQYISRVMTE